MKLTLDSINNINLFENLTGARVRDCFEDNGKLVFLIQEGDLKKAIGKEGSNIKRVSNVMKKDIKVLGFSEDVCKFVGNLIYPNKAEEIRLEENTVKIISSDMVVKGKIFGRSKENLKKINSIVKKYFPSIEEVLVI